MTTELMVSKSEEVIEILSGLTQAEAYTVLTYAKQSLIGISIVQPLSNAEVTDLTPQ